LAREKIRLPLFYKEKHLTGWDAFLLCFRNDTFDWRWRRRSELLYKYKNDPYIESLREGKLDTPENGTSNSSRTGEGLMSLRG